MEDCSVHWSDGSPDCSHLTTSYFVFEKRPLGMAVFVNAHFYNRYLQLFHYWPYLEIMNVYDIQTFYFYVNTCLKYYFQSPLDPFAESIF